MEDFEELVKEAKGRNIDIMLDMVFNHTSTEHEWFKRALKGEEKYKNYYIFKEGKKGEPPTNWISKFGGNAWEYVEELGEYCDFLSVVIEGKIEIQKLDSNGNILVVATLNRGNVFGENLLFGDRNFYPMSVVAKENSQVLHIKKDYIYKLCSSNEAFLRELLRILSNKALNLSSKLKQVTMKSIREMICNYLLKKYNKEKSTTIKLEFSRKDWADKLGVQRPSLSRELMKMRDAGLIDFSKNIIEIKDLEGLKGYLL